MKKIYYKFVKFFDFLNYELASPKHIIVKHLLTKEKYLKIVFDKEYGVIIDEALLFIDNVYVVFGFSKRLLASLIWLVFVLLLIHYQVIELVIYMTFDLNIALGKSVPYEFTLWIFTIRWFAFNCEYAIDVIDGRFKSKYKIVFK